MQHVCHFCEVPVLEQFILISVIITIIFISLCNISLCCWVREPHQNQNGLSGWSPLSPVIQAWHSGFKILTSLRARFQMTTGAQMTVGSPLPCPGYHDYKINIMVYRNMSTSLGLGEPQFKTYYRSHLAGTFHTPAMCLQAWRTCTCTFPRAQSQ